MDPIVLTGTVRSFGVKEPKQDDSAEPKPLLLKTLFCVTAPDLDILARLCKNTAEAAKAMKAAVKAGGESKIPCRPGTMTVSWKKGGNKKATIDSQAVALNRVMLDGRNDGPTAKVSFTEPLDRNLAGFLLDMLGKDLEISIVQSQDEMFEAQGEEPDEA